MNITEIAAIIGGGAAGWIVGSLIGSFICDKIELKRLRKELTIEKLKLEILNSIYK